MIPFEEALHGLRREGAIVFPQAIGLAATWDTTLVAKVAQAAAREARRRGIRDVLSPVINIANDARWGRVEETYGEDPYLSARMGVAERIERVADQPENLPYAQLFERRHQRLRHGLGHRLLLCTALPPGCGGAKSQR